MDTDTDRPPTTTVRRRADIGFDKPTHRTVRPCNQCGSNDLMRSRRRHVELALSWVGLLPYRCMSCDKRCYRFEAAS
jgi:hypothetical protein